MRRYYGNGMCGRSESKRMERVKDVVICVLGVIVFAMFAYGVWVMPW